MKNYFVSTANDDYEILGIEAVFEEEARAAQWCSEKNKSEMFGTYTYAVLTMDVAEVH